MYKMKQKVKAYPTKENAIQDLELYEKEYQAILEKIIRHNIVKFKEQCYEMKKLKIKI